MRRIAALGVTVLSVAACGSSESDSGVGACDLELLERPVVTTETVDVKGARQPGRYIEPIDPSDVITDVLPGSGASDVFVATQREDGTHHLTIIDALDEVETYDLGDRVPVALSAIGASGLVVVDDGDQFVAMEWSRDRPEQCSELGPASDVADIETRRILVRDRGQVRQHRVEPSDEGRTLDVDVRDVAHLPDGGFVGATRDRVSLFGSDGVVDDQAAILPARLFADLEPGQPAVIGEVLVVDSEEFGVFVVAIVDLEEEGSVVVALNTDGDVLWRWETEVRAHARRVGDHHLLVWTGFDRTVLDLTTGSAERTEETDLRLPRSPGDDSLIEVTPGAGWLTTGGGLGDIELTLWDDGRPIRPVTVELDAPARIDWAVRSNGATALGLDLGRAAVVLERVVA